MIIDRTHLRWGLATATATVITTAFYLANNHPEILPLALPAWLGSSPPLRGNIGATPLGLIYGTLAAAIFIFAALLGWRRSRPSLRIGPIKVWLKAHIWFTIFTIPLILFHCGFRGGGPMTQFLLWLYALVMVSGFWGLALQHIVPKLMREYLPGEVIFEQIPYIRSQIVAVAQTERDKLIPAPIAAPVVALAGAAPEGEKPMAAPPEPAVISESLQGLLDFIDLEALPYLCASTPRKLRLRDAQISDDLFRLVKLHVPEPFRATVDRFQGLCDERRALDLQVRLQRWLHGWLLVHAPASILLVILTLWHAAVATLFYA